MRDRAVEALLVTVEPALDARDHVDHPLVQRLELALDVGGVRDEVALRVAEDDALGAPQRAGAPPQDREHDQRDQRQDGGDERHDPGGSVRRSTVSAG